ncbi:MAG: DUF2760 domain-containing protein [Planctomycetota bacterium]|nr:DUF2760 domain-containing protein [Planctomycetota bacterium]
MRLFFAIRVFFKVLFDAATAGRIESLLSGELPAPAAAPPAGPAEATKQRQTPTSSRSDALTLLATMQQEARFLDLVQEPLGEYSDSQVGAAARDVLRDCNAVLQRMFKIEPVVAQDEGTECETPKDFQPGRFRLTGSVVGDPPYRGQLTHKGWEATTCELPTWSGSDLVAQVLAPAEVEIA